MRAFTKEELAFIRENRKTDVKQLALKGSPFEEVSIQELLQQIVGLQIAEKKFPSLAAVPSYRFPVRVSLEQASSEQLAKYKGSLVSGQRFADLTGGMGVDTYFMGKQFEVVDYVEKNEQLSEIARSNFESLAQPNFTVHQTDAISFLQNAGNYDWLYIDPDRRKNNSRTISADQYDPNIYELEAQLMSHAKKVLIKISPMQDIAQLFTKLNHIEKITICEYKNELKEILITLAQEKTKEPLLNIVVFQGDFEHSYQLKFDDANTNPIISAGPVNFLFEPGPGIQKAGVQNVFGEQHRLKKIHSNSQLFSSDEAFFSPFGKTFIVKQQCSLSQKEILPLLDGKKANVISRNFPLDAPGIKKKLNIKDGGHQYLIATTLGDGSRVVFLCERILKKETSL